MCLEFKNVHYSEGKQKILDSISFKLIKGSVAGYLGPNGAGKTTTIRLALGLLKKDAGEVFAFGKEQSEFTLSDREKIACVLDVDGLNSFLSGRENLHFFADLYNIRNTNSKIPYWLDRFNISNIADVFVKKLSKGQRKLFALARCFLVNPNIMILDEPFANLDPKAQKICKNIILEISKTNGTSFFISSHDLSLIDNICDTVGFINKGKLIFWGDIESLKKDNICDGIVIQSHDINQLAKLKDLISHAQISYSSIVIDDIKLILSGQSLYLLKHISEVIYNNNVIVEKIIIQPKKSLLSVYEDILSESVQ